MVKMGGKCKCDKAPHYGLDGKPTHCSVCKTEGMVRRMKEHIALLQKQYDKEASKKSK